MIVEQRTYTLKPGKTSPYLQLYSEKGLAVQTSHLGKLLGYYLAEIGTLNQIVHMWAYVDLADRAKRREALFADPAWTAVVSQLYEMIEHMETRILVPTHFSPALA